MENKVYGELKRRALLAKQRLKLGYWEQIRKEREQLLKTAGETDSAVRKVSELQRAKFNREMNGAINVVTANRDEEMYKRVCDILDGDEDVMNPIGLLVDNDRYSTLDDGAKQRYILELSKKFIELKERYYMERPSKSG